MTRIRKLLLLLLPSPFSMVIFSVVVKHNYKKETYNKRYRKMKIIPLGDRVLLKAKEAETKTAGGLFIPQTAQEKTQIATVVAVGDDESIKVKVGQQVLHDKYAGTQIKDNGEEYLILGAGDILAVIE